MKIIISKNNAAEKPGDWICPVNGVDNWEELHCNGYVGNADYAPADEHGIHGHFCSSCPAHYRGNSMGKSKGKKENGFCPHLVNADFDNSGVAVEKGNDPGTD